MLIDIVEPAKKVLQDSAAAIGLQALRKGQVVTYGLLAYTHGSPNIVFQYNPLCRRQLCFRVCGKRSNGRALVAEAVVPCRSRITEDPIGATGERECLFALRQNFAL